MHLNGKLYQWGSMFWCVVCVSMHQHQHGMRWLLPGCMLIVVIVGLHHDRVGLHMDGIRLHGVMDGELWPLYCHRWVRTKPKLPQCIWQFPKL